MIHVLEGVCKPNVQSPGVFKEHVPQPLLNLLNSIQHILILVNRSTFYRYLMMGLLRVTVLY